MDEDPKEKPYDLRSINLGAGVQSTAMYLMACEGELTPMPSVAIFADTQAEPPWVYEHLDWLEKNFSHIIPIHRCTSGSLIKNLYDGGEGRKGFSQIPAHLSSEEGDGISRRTCTGDYKIKPIQRATREFLGLKPRQRAKGKYRVQQWIGISLDEVHRAKPSDVAWIERHYPLIFDKKMQRSECIEWLSRRGYPIPRKSSCFFCPYHNDAAWRELRDDAPLFFSYAVQIDDDLRKGKMRCSEGLKKTQYLHSRLKPLSETTFNGDDQLSLFGNECEGVCGV